MDCREIEAHLGEWLCGALEDELELSVSRHLGDCAGCRRSVDELGRLEDELRGSRSTAVVGTGYGRIAAAAAIFLLAALAVGLAARRQPRDGGRAPREVVAAERESPAAPLRLEEGGLVRAAAGAEVEEVDGRSVELRTGEIEVDARGASRGVSVLAADVRVHARDAVYRVEIGSEEVMNGKVVAAGVTVVSVAVVAGSVYLFSGDDAPVELEEGQTAVVHDEGAVGDVAPQRARRRDDERELQEARRRVAELEARLAALEEESRDSERAIEEHVARNDELEARVEELEQQVEEEGGGENGLERGPAAVADILGLEDSRKEALEAAWQRTSDEARELEKRFAEVESDGERTTIRIPAHPEEWGAVKKRFDDELGMILTPTERERYGKLGLDKNLFEGPDGTQDRTIELGPHEKGFQSKETATRDGSTTVTNGIFGGENGREQALAGYLHLLDR